MTAIDNQSGGWIVAAAIKAAAPGEIVTYHEGWSDRPDAATKSRFATAALAAAEGTAFLCQRRLPGIRLPHAKCDTPTGFAYLAIKIGKRTALRLNPDQDRH